MAEHGWCRCVRQYVARGDDTVSHRGRRRELTVEEKSNVQRRRMKAGRKEKEDSLPELVTPVGMNVESLQT